MNDFDPTMTISELIGVLTEIKEEYGNIPMYITVGDSNEALSRIRCVHNLEIVKPNNDGISITMNIATISNVCFGPCDNEDCEYHYRHHDDHSEE